VNVVNQVTKYQQPEHKGNSELYKVFVELGPEKCKRRLEQTDCVVFYRTHHNYKHLPPDSFPLLFIFLVSPLSRDYDIQILGTHQKG
jgi:hypothetical protein